MFSSYGYPYNPFINNSYREKAGKNMECAKCGKSTLAPMDDMCPTCYLDTPPAGVGLEPIYPGDIVEVLKEDSNHGLRGTVVPCSSGWHTVDVWVCLRRNRSSDPYYEPYSRDEVKLYSRYHSA
jgi:hypothetical protein